MPKLIMNPGHEYEVFGRMVRAGEEFEVPENEAQIWQTLGRARRRGPGRPRKEDAGAGRYARSDMRAEDE